MKKILLLFAVIISVIVVLIVMQASNSKGNEKVELTISAATSLQEVLNDIKEVYKKEHPTVNLNINFGGSGTLQKQISEGAPVDLFMSASERHFAPLIANDEIVKGDYVNLLKNEIVLVVPKGNVKLEKFEELIGVQSISIGTPETVPAGRYAVELFQSIGIWDEVEPNIIYANNVRQVLTYVETGNVEAGIVYKTDILNSDKIQIVATANESLHSPIVYPVGILKGSKHYKEAKDFYYFLQSEEIVKVFERYGFTAI